MIILASKVKRRNISWLAACACCVLCTDFVQVTAMRPVTQQQAKSSGRSSGSFLGKENIPLLGLGLAALGRPGYINIGHGMDLKETKCDVEAMRSRCHAVLDTAKDLGLRYIDCARSYGRSEDFLSSWFGDDSRTRPDDMLVGSKWGYRYTADWRVDTAGAPHEVKEHSATHLASQVQETCGHLGNFINLYQTHSATLDSGALSDEVVAGLWAIRKEKGWRIGLSLSGVAQSETLRAAMRVKDPQTGEMLFQCVQATWNLLEQSAGEALLEAKEAGMDVIIKEGVANGRLTERNTSERFASCIAELQQVASSLGVGMDAVALAAAMAQPFKPMVLSGATTPEMLRSNAGALKIVDALVESGRLDNLMAAMRQDSHEYWCERAALEWN